MTTTDPRDITRQAVLEFIALRHLEARVKDAIKHTRAALVELMQPGERIPATTPAGDPIGQVSMTKPSVTLEFAVTDEPAFREWVSANHPEAIQVRTTVEILPYFTAAKNLEAVIKDNNGEVPPGVEVREKTREPHPTYTKKPEEADNFMTALAAGEFTPIIMRQIEAGADDE